MKFKFLGITIMMALLAGGSFFSAEADADDDKKISKAEKRLASIVEKYQPTGVVKSCVSMRSLRNSRIIDDKTIFFKSIGKRAYINRLPRRCRRLAYEERFSYSTSIGLLCKNEIITVLDSMGSALNSCGLGQFEEWEKKPKAK
jgi:hypothetical protein